MDLTGRPRGRTSRRSRSSQRRSFHRERRVSLCETLDRVLNRGAVIAGDLVISVADVDLLYVGLNLVVASVETLRNATATRPRPRDER